MLLRGDCITSLSALDANSIDAVITDPPYGLANHKPSVVSDAITRWATGDRAYTPTGAGFMGKSWDGFVPPPAVWDECYRVLKPGGHLLAFAGSRTSDFMGISVRMAGFEIRDTIAWIYGSGFPKSLNVSKAIDKQRYGKQDVYKVTAWICEARDRAGISNRDIDNAFGFAGMAGHWTSSKSQPAVPTLEQIPTLLRVLRVRETDIPDEILALLVDLNTRKGQPGANWFKREKIGSSANGIAGGTGKHSHNESVYGFSEVFDITVPASDDAMKWDGWGTALKPALEPIIVARKPLDGTVAQNVTTYGTGAINIDACRVGTETITQAWVDTSPKIVGANQQQTGTKTTTVGRWPANVIIDDHAATIIDEQANAARFFYVAKPSRAERNAGLDDLPQHDPENDVSERQGSLSKPRANFHPTVKPLTLIRYIARLVTQPGGTILDPFLGSGTTACAAILEGYNWIGCELTDEYWPIIEARTTWAKQQIAQETKAPKQLTIDNETGDA